MRHEARVVPAQALLHHYRTECPVDMSGECRDNYYRYTETDQSLGRLQGAAGYRGYKDNGAAKRR